MSSSSVLMTEFRCTARCGLSSQLQRGGAVHLLWVLNTFLSSAWWQSVWLLRWMEPYQNNNILETKHQLFSPLIFTTPVAVPFIEWNCSDWCSLFDFYAGGGADSVSGNGSDYKLCPTCERVLSFLAFSTLTLGMQMWFQFSMHRLQWVQRVRFDMVFLEIMFSISRVRNPHPVWAWFMVKWDMLNTSESH